MIKWQCHNGYQDVTKVAAAALLSIVADFKQFSGRFCAFTHPNMHEIDMFWGIMME